jgi:hypothetical protein
MRIANSICVRTQNFYRLHIATQRARVLQKIVQQLFGDLASVHHPFNRLGFCTFCVPRSGVRHSNILTARRGRLNHHSRSCIRDVTKAYTRSRCLYLPRRLRMAAAFFGFDFFSAFGGTRFMAELIGPF